MEKKRLVVFLLLGLIILFCLQRPDKNFHVVFCDVGEGDAILLIQKNNQILVDGGPGSSVLKCLSNNVPFWDRKLEAVLLTHPDADHYSGLIEVLKRYKIENFFAPPLGQKNDLSFKKLISLLIDQKITPQALTQGDKIRVGLIDFDIFWPTKNKLKELETFQDISSFQNGFWLISESLVNNNEFSLVARATFDQFDLLLTGDLPSNLSQTLAWQNKLPQVEILKASHHGSGADNPDELYDKTNPKLVAISVGENNYGHPGKELLEKLKKLNIPAKRTDEKGDIEIISDGKSWWVAD
ncbi:MAG: MBL fold metallo-hydrolase [Candidatus Shapirobacteria bacterium]